MQAVSILQMTPQYVSETIRPVLACFPVDRAWLFGSVARGTQTRGSDIDLIVELQEYARLGLGFMDLEEMLCQALRHAVDVSTLQRERSTPIFLSSFDRDKVLVYERKTG